VREAHIGAHQRAEDEGEGRPAPPAAEGEGSAFSLLVERGPRPIEPRVRSRAPTGAPCDEGCGEIGWGDRIRLSKIRLSAVAWSSRTPSVPASLIWCWGSWLSARLGRPAVVRGDATPICATDPTLVTTAKRPLNVATFGSGQPTIG
jgi:hypothetical protein